MENLSINEYVVHSKMPEWGIGKIVYINEDVIEVDFPNYKKASFKCAVVGDMICRVDTKKGVDFWRKNRREEYCNQIIKEEKEAQRKKITQLLKESSKEEKDYYRKCRVGAFIRHEGRTGVIAMTGFQDGTITPKSLAIFLDSPRYKKITKISEIIPKNKLGLKSIEEVKLTHILFLFQIGIRGLYRYSWRSAKKEKRITHCYKCRKGLDNRIHLECSGCKWIICPNCGACGHGFFRCY